MRGIRTVVQLVAALLLASAAHAQSAAPAKLVPAQSEVTFQIKQSGVPVDGKFKRFDAQLALDPKAPQTGSVTVSIDTGSGTVGFPESDVELPRAPWFNTAKFPRAVFQASAITRSAPALPGQGQARAEGNDARSGRSGDDRPERTTIDCDRRVRVKRLDYKIGEGEWTDLSLVANDVRVRFKLVFTGVGPL